MGVDEGEFRGGRKTCEYSLFADKRGRATGDIGLTTEVAILLLSCMLLCGVPIGGATSGVRA